MTTVSTRGVKNLNRFTGAIPHTVVAVSIDDRVTKSGWLAPKHTSPDPVFTIPGGPIKKDHLILFHLGLAERPSGRIQDRRTSPCLQEKPALADACC
ncbi:hypothetical protein DPEC_G00350360 [Dallia pectoralis]|uniref:Uncharacterized protein n=1 Tax=Dallia pectoralis TaxID=75939 RepID=A0ACC2F1P3_DALPE|nr:hypothetical protein DPEC_G00350360 [Dallia pectoralis]